MVKHIVSFKLKERTPENIEIMKKLILSMKDNIDLIRDIRVEEDLLHTPDSFDLMLFADFDSKADLEAYVKHPYHWEYVGGMSKAYVSEVHPFDYEY